MPRSFKSLNGAANMLLSKDPVFEEVVLNPKILTMVEIMCGKGAMLSQLAGSIKSKGGPSLPLHADQNWTPEDSHFNGVIRRLS